MQRQIKILEVNAEGGSITLYGIEFSGRWYFGRKIVEQTPELLNEAWVVEQSGFVETFEMALKLIEGYPWYNLYPEFVHPDFRQEVYAAVLAKLESSMGGESDRLVHWRELCESL